MKLIGLGGHGSGWGWFLGGSVKICPVCWTGVGDSGVGALGIETVWAKVVVSSGASGTGLRSSSGSEVVLESGMSEDCCLESSGSWVVLSRQALLGMAGKPLLGEYSG